MKLTKESPGCARDESGLSLLVGVPVEYGTFDQRLVKAGAFIEEVIHRVELYDEMVEALRSTLPDKKAEAVLAKVERKG